MINAGFTELLLGLLAILLLVAAVVDVRTFTISNSLNLAVALAAVALIVLCAYNGLRSLIYVCDETSSPKISREL